MPEQAWHRQLSRSHVYGTSLALPSLNLTRSDLSPVTAATTPVPAREGGEKKMC